MVNKIIKKVSDVNSLSLSYNDVIERITGSKNDSFKIPSSIIKAREKFWDDFFFKYSEQEFKETDLDIFTLKPCGEKSQKSIVETKKELVCKPSSVIQYWINTGYLPYKILYMNKNKLDVGLFTEKSASSSHPRSSSSSVDTAAYILSNMNVTNKVETMAIIEGAKDNSVITSHNAQDIKITQDKMHKTNNENVILKNNNGSITLENNDNMLQRKNINLDEYITKTQRNSNDDDIDILSETINTDNETTNKYKSDYNKLLTNKMLMHTFDDINRNSHIEQNVKLSNAEEPHSIKENGMLEDSFIKIGRKKLYSGRDSPIDLIRTESSNRSTISISNQSLHPALDFGCNSSKKFKIYNKKRTYHSAPFHKLINNSRLSVSYYDKRKRRIKKRNEQKFKTSLTNVIEDTVSINQNITDDSMLNQYLVKGKTDKCATSSLYKKLANKQEKFNESINCLQEMNIEIYQKTNNTTKELENLNPLLCLTRLSYDDIAKYKKLKKTTNINNLDKIRLQEVNTERHKKSNKMTKHLVIRLSRLSKRDIEKYKKPNNIKLNLNPVVRLKRLSELEIQKYTKSINMMKSFENSDTVTSLNRILNESGALKSTQLQNDSVNDINQLSSSNIMKLVTEDTTSESSVLIYKCDSISFDDCSIDNLSMFSKSSFHSYSTTVKNHMLEIEERFYNKRKRLNSEVRNKKVDKACVKKRVKRINNERSLKLNTSKNNVMRKYATRDRKYTKVYSMDNSFNNNSKPSAINKDVHHTNDISLCPDEPRIVFENNNANANKNKKRQYITFSSDEDDEFMKLIHCSKDIQKSKLRKQHKTLNNNFNTVEKLGTILSNQSYSDSPIKDTRFKRMNKNCNQKLIKVQTEIKNQTKLLPINKKRKSLCFRTKIFDSDSESLTTS